MFLLSLSIAFIVAFFVAWLLYRADKNRAVPYPIVTASLRGLVVFFTLFLLLSPKINKTINEIQKPIVLLLQDNSTSIKAALGKDSAEYQKKLKTIIDNSDKQYQLVFWNLDGQTNKDSIHRYTATSTDIAKAINEATEVYGQQNLSAIVLATDAWYNEGSNPLYTQIPINSTLYGIALGDTSIPQDIRISKTYANKSTTLNSQWELRADILATGIAGTQAIVSLTDATGNVIATSPINIKSNKFDVSVSFTIKATKAGLQRYRLSIPKVKEEQNTSNNSSTIFVDVVQEKKKILLLAAAPHPDIKAISEALKGVDQYELSIKMASEMPSNFAEYTCIILHQLPNSNTNISEAMLIGKSVWYFAGKQNNYFELNKLQPAVKFSFGLAPRNADAQFQIGFSAFSLPKNIATVSDLLPPLEVSVKDAIAAPNAQNIFVDAQRNALWTTLSGNNPIAVIAGEGLWRWRLHEYKNFGTHEVIDECIRQTIHFLCANKNNKTFRTELAKQVWNNPEYIHINAFLLNDNNEAINQPEAKLSITDEQNKTRNFNFERYENNYRINVGALPEGNYSYIAHTILNGKALNDKGSFSVQSISLENQETGCNYSLLYALAQQNNGNTFTLQTMTSLTDSLACNNNIKAVYTEHIEASDLINWKWIFFIILILATTEWLLRKYWMAM